MAKPTVTDLQEGTQVPYLRGILTGSLQAAGLAFETAYAIASEVREALDERGDVTTDQLRAMVAERLEKAGAEEALQRYTAAPVPAGSVVVTDAGGKAKAFSRAMHTRGLLVAGLPGARAHAVTSTVYRSMVEMGINRVTSDQIVERTTSALGSDDPATRRYLAWVAFQRSGRPLVVLMGGTAGAGKSTTAVDLAQQLDIVRTQSTDMLREVMRLMLPERLLPVLHVSSFQAWLSLPGNQQMSRSRTASVIRGFQQQSELVSVAAEAVVQRALTERVSVILEGVHIEPEFMQRVRAASDAVVVPVMVAVLKRTALRERLGGRGARVASRAAARYLDGFDDIWRLQGHLLAEADRCDVPIVANVDKSDTVAEVIALIMDGVADAMHTEGAPSPRETG